MRAFTIIFLLPALFYLTHAQEACSTLHATAAIFCRCESEASLSCASEFPMATRDSLRAVCATHMDADVHIDKAELCGDLLPTNVRNALEKVLAARAGRRGGGWGRPRPSYYYRAVQNELDHVDVGSVKRSRLMRYNDIRV